jgi:hypothetical protein
MHITTHGNLVTNTWKRLNLQMATLVLGLTLAGGAVLSSGLMSNSGVGNESTAPAAAVPSISTEFGTLADAADANPIILAATEAAAAVIVHTQQFATMADAAGSQPLEATGTADKFEPEFATMADAVFALAGQ